jgi:hypothetical protein
MALIARTQVIGRPVEEVFATVIGGGNFAMNLRGIFRRFAPMIAWTGRRNLRDGADAREAHLQGRTT